ncbi:Gfo/Idh/MocA family protein [Leeuwenhoekiella marinoflava]|uniref:Predicted dehydrogenase n=2 Tax=Leeuwenhoekiella marinoflava TaxID=988 RepID=A0ABY1HX68_9FLAO|nr:Gfo/Idh/MocA family oxidoreductase [Leeuwenhoekiella marinoflava]RXG25891.1 putative dehydrogenase [Leeuwenhoekiella marinoflava]SHF99796.1 Predicted dehydrogenase [Leeuwenhoekiella marinoflava DSM 3653]
MTLFKKISILTLLLLLTASTIFAQKKLKVVVAGLSHDHAHIIMNAYQNNTIELLGIAEDDEELVKRYRKTYEFSQDLVYKSLETLLKSKKPDVVLAYNPVSEHIDIAQICMPLNVPLMVEKPLAINMKQANKMAVLSKKFNTPLLTNYETTWYNSIHKQKDLLEDSKEKIVRMVARDGHQGPKEIGCSTEFLEWLTDKDKNGAGALFDFGCYGANLMTYFKNGEKPVSVKAVTQQLKPSIYPDVDDDASIILEYKNATGIIEASWSWPYSIKNFEVFTTKTSYDAVDGNTLLKSSSHFKPEKISLKENYYTNHIDYLTDYLSGKIKPINDLSSLENNLIVVEILEAAKKSAKTGKTIKL